MAESIRGTVAIRRAARADAAALAAFGARVFAETFGHSVPPSDLEAYLASAYGRALQEAEIARGDMATLLAEAGDDLVGFAQLRRGPPPDWIEAHAPVELFRFYVDPGWHGRGTAQALLREARAAAPTLGDSALWLGVWEENARAIAFYRKSGFREVGSQVFWVGRTRQRDLIMVADAT